MDKADIKVLITDDHDEIRENLRNNFRLINGVQVVGEASSGEEAIEFVKNHEVDLVTMDVYMGGITGLQAMEEIHAFRPDLPIVVYTSDNLIGLQSYQKGALFWLTKPASIDDLEDLLAFVSLESTKVWA